MRRRQTFGLLPIVLGVDGEVFWPAPEEGADGTAVEGAVFEDITESSDFEGGGLDIDHRKCLCGRGMPGDTDCRRIVAQRTDQVVTGANELPHFPRVFRHTPETPY